MLSAQSAKIYFLEFVINSCKLKTSWQQLFRKLKIDGNLVIKSKVPPHSGSIALRQLNPNHEKRPSSFFKKNKINT